MLCVVMLCCFAEVTTKLLHEVFNKQDRQRDDWFLLLFLTFVTDHQCSQWSAVDDFSEAALWSGGAALKQSFSIVIFCSRPSNSTQPSFLEEALRTLYVKGFLLVVTEVLGISADLMLHDEQGNTRHDEHVCVYGLYIQPLIWDVHIL